MDTLDSQAVWEILRGLVHFKMQLSHLLSKEIKACVWAEAKGWASIWSFFFFFSLMEGELKLGGERSGRRWNTKHASKAKAPEGRGNTELHLKKFWHCTSIISTAALSPSSLSLVLSSYPFSKFLTSKCYLCKNWSFSVLALSPPWRHAVLFGTQLPIPFTERKKIKIRILLFNPFFVLPLQYLSSG